MPKKFIVLLSLLFLSLTCARVKTDFSFWIGGAPEEVNYWEKLIHNFERSSGYQIRVIRQPTDSDQRRQGLVISLESRQPDPDVFLMDVIWVGQFVHSGWLESLDSLLEHSGYSLGLFLQRVIDQTDRYGEKIYSLPVYVDGGLLYYRTDLLQKYGYRGPPETWDGLLSMALDIQKKERPSNPGFYGFVWQGAQYEGLVCNFLEYAASNGGGIMVDNRYRMDCPPNIQALSFMQDLIHKHKISPPNTYTEMKEEDVRRFFEQGNALFERNWPYAWSLHQSSGSSVKGKTGIGPLPCFQNGSPSSTLGGWHIGISRYSDVKERAWELVRHILSYPVQKKLALNLGWNSGRTDIYQDPDVLQELPHLQKLQQIFQNTVARPNLPYYIQVSKVIQRFANRCLAGKIKAREALSEMQKEINRMSRAYGKK